MEQYTEEILQKKTVAELRDIIKGNGLKATSKIKKADLIALVLGENETSVFDDATKKFAERIQKELDEANKKLKELLLYRAAAVSGLCISDGEIVCRTDRFWWYCLR